jgi:hypothetical protein
VDETPLFTQNSHNLDGVNRLVIHGWWPDRYHVEESCDTQCLTVRTAVRCEGEQWLFYLDKSNGSLHCYTVCRRHWIFRDLLRTDKLRWPQMVITLPLYMSHKIRLEFVQPRHQSKKRRKR